jgi:hypothetical protein
MSCLALSLPRIADVAKECGERAISFDETKNEVRYYTPEGNLNPLPSSGYTITSGFLGCVGGKPVGEDIPAGFSTGSHPVEKPKLSFGNVSNSRLVQRAWRRMEAAKTNP